jgi:hypothetical protein
VHEIQHPFWQARFFQKLDQEDCGERHLFAGFEYEGVAAGEGQREHPKRDHGGKIERSDAGADAERLMYRFAIHIAGQILQGIPHEEAGDATGIFDIFQSPIDAAPGLGQSLSMFPRDQLAQGVKIFFNQLPVTEEQAGPLDRRGLSPGREGGLSRGYGGVDLGLAAGGAFGNHLAAGRVVDRGGREGLEVKPFSVDECGAGGHEGGFGIRDSEVARSGGIFVNLEFGIPNPSSRLILKVRPIV